MSILLHCRSLSDSTATSVGYSREKFDSVTEQTVTRRVSDAAPSVNVSKQLSHPIIKSDHFQNSKLQRQLSAPLTGVIQYPKELKLQLKRAGLL